MTPADFIRRRWFLQQCGVGLGALAARSFVAAESKNPLAPRKPHYAAKAKIGLREMHIYHRMVSEFIAKGDEAAGSSELFNQAAEDAQMDRHEVRRDRFFLDARPNKARRLE